MKISLTKTKNIVTPDLKRKLATAKNPKKAMEAAGLTVVSMAQRAFTQPGLRPLSWPALKPATIKAKQKKGYGTKPLVSSGALAHSPRIIRVTSTTVTVGSDRKVGSHSLAAIHQMGTKDGKIPARPFFPFTKSGKPTDRAEKNIISAIKRSLDADLKKP